MKIGFDNDLYLKTQSEHIKERIEKFGAFCEIFPGKYGLLHIS